MSEQVRDLAKERGYKVSEETFGMTINGGIGDGRNDGGPAYCVDTVEESEDE